MGDQFGQRLVSLSQHDGLPGIYNCPKEVTVSWPQRQTEWLLREILSLNCQIKSTSTICVATFAKKNEKYNRLFQKNGIFLKALSRYDRALDSSNLRPVLDYQII
jgi:hypothetical protein